MSVKLGQSRTPANTRIYAVGDVHGYLDLLKQLHVKINEDVQAHPIDHHRIIFLGDYIDRGPESAGCVDYLIELLKNDHSVTCLKGNHEAKLQSFLVEPHTFADSFFTWGGIETAQSYGVDMNGYRGEPHQIEQVCADLNENIPEAHQIFYEQLDITVSCEDYMFTHAGVRPSVPLDKQSEQDLMWIRSEFIPYQGLFDKVIVHGHTPAYPMEILPNRINVDTHAYDTGVLSCVVLEGTGYKVIEATANDRH